MCTISMGEELNQKIQIITFKLKQKDSFSTFKKINKLKSETTNKLLEITPTFFY